jgi:hypothetical protein
MCIFVQTNLDCLHMLDLGETQHLMRSMIYHIHNHLREMNKAAGQTFCDTKAVVTVIHELADCLRLVQVTAPQLSCPDRVHMPRAYQGLSTHAPVTKEEVQAIDEGTQM